MGKVADITEDLCVTVSRDVRVTKFLDFHAVRRDGRINAVDNHGVSITRQVNDQLMCSGRAKARDIHFGHIASSCARDHYWCAAVNGVAEDACRIFEVDRERGGVDRVERDPGCRAGCVETQTIECAAIRRLRSCL